MSNRVPNAPDLIAVAGDWHGNLRWALTAVRAAALVALLLIPVLGAVFALHGSAPRHRSQTDAITPATGLPVSAVHTVGTPDSMATASPSAATSLETARPELPTIDDPAEYARAAAVALFQLDPATVTRRAFLDFWHRQLPSVVYTDATAKGLTLADQNHDAIDNLTRWWIPPQQVWDSEAADHTRSRFTITSVTVPDYWANAVANGTYRDPGLHMQRVMGVLTQTYDTPPPQYRAHHADCERGHGEGDRVAFPRVGEPGVVIDLGLLCGPTQPGGCRLVAPQKPPALGAS